MMRYERYPDELLHHGIKGQKWGKRNGPPYPLDYSDHSSSERKANWQQSLDRSHGGYGRYVFKKGDTVLKKGTKFQRITVNSNSGNTKGVFTSYKIKDKDLYKGTLGRQRLTYLANHTAEPIQLNELMMTAKEDIRLPSRKTRIDEFIKLYNNDKQGVLDLINEHEVSRYKRKKIYGEFDSNNSSKVSSMYEKFNDAFGMGQDSKNYHVIEKYYSNLSKKGYNAIPDENDIRLSTYKAQAPIIMFDTTKSIGKISTRKLSASEVYAAYTRSFGQKCVRDALLPSGVGFENLTPDSIAKSKKYNRQLKSDKYTLSEKYTIDNLADDWGKNRLSNRQIKKVSDAMDEGKSHEEALNDVIHLGNSVLDKILDKYDL